MQKEKATIADTDTRSGKIFCLEFLLGSTTSTP